MAEIMTDQKTSKDTVVKMSGGKASPQVEQGRPASEILNEIRHSPDQIKDLFRNGKYPYKNRIKKAAYETHKEELQVELLKVQNWVKLTGQRIVVICEGATRQARAARSSVLWNTSILEHREW